MTKQDRKITEHVLNEIVEKSNKILDLKIKSYLNKIFIEIIKHYKDHKEEYSICVSNIDPYKICAWSLDYLIKETKNKRLIVPILIVMLTFLKQEKRSFDIKKLNYIIKMYMNNNKKDEFAIGKNGLFMIFWSASNCEILP